MKFSAVDDDLYFGVWLTASAHISQNSTFNARVNVDGELIVEENEGFWMSEFVPTIGRFLLILFFATNMAFDFTNVCVDRHRTIERDPLKDWMPPADRDADVLIRMLGDSGRSAVQLFDGPIPTVENLVLRCTGHF